MTHESTTHIVLYPIIEQFKEMEVDGETMQWFIEQVGMEHQMLKQLLMSRNGTSNVETVTYDCEVARH